MQITKGFAGRILFVDLTTRRISVEPLDSRDVEKFGGAAGVNAKLLYELAKPGIDPLGPDNVFIYGIGAFGATMVPGMARTVITTKSPRSGFYGTSAAGHFGPMLKLAGYDHVVITGKADGPVYLKVIDDDVSIEDASQLWGKDVFETTDALWSAYPGSWVSCIGPAGENKVTYACVINNKYSTFGTSGLGAAMGAKNLKAVVAIGGKSVQLADPRRFQRIVDRVHKELREARHFYNWRQYGTLIQVQPMAASMKYDEGKRTGYDVSDWTQYFLENVKGHYVTCPSCPVGCKAGVDLKEGKHKGISFTATCPMGTLTQVVSHMAPQYNDAIKYSESANRFGICMHESRLTINFAIRLFEDGLIGTADTGGLELRSRDPESYLGMLRKIVYRQDIGDLLAGRFAGVREKVGPEVDRYMAVVKGIFSHHLAQQVRNEQGGEWVVPRVRWGTTTLGILINPRGPQFNAYSSLTIMPERSADSLRKYCLKIGVPESHLDALLTGETDGYDTALLTKYVEAYNLVLYNMASCQRPLISNVLDVDTLADLFSAATGIKTSAADMLAAAERTINLQRLFTLREGLTRDHDRYPRGWLEGDQEEEMENLLDAYYASHGWDKASGTPTRETLARLDLEEYALAGVVRA